MKKIVAIISTVAVLTVLGGCAEIKGQDDFVSQLENGSKGNIQNSNPQITVPHTDLSTQEKENYYKKYVDPLYITGIMYETWDDVSDININRLLKFYEYNAFFEQLPQIISKDPAKYQDLSVIEMPADNVETFMMYYFNIDQQQLQTADAYDNSANVYKFSKDSGIGGGPGLEIISITDDGENKTFLLTDMEGSNMSLTVQIINEDQFLYISGACSKA